MDDGFQHWRLARDLDIVMIDASLPLAKQMLLPLGRLREPLGGLKRAGIFCLTKIDIAADNYQTNRKLLNKINPEAICVGAVYEPVGFYDLETDVLSSLDLGKPAAILCGIANPSYFENMLEEAGLKVGRKFIYPDHHNYSERDLKFIKRVILSDKINTIVTTHKDAVRLRQFTPILGDVKIFYLKIKLKIIENEKVLRARLLSLLSR
jgi:tetraacyldisaccharide 4'-kinase